MKLYLIVAQGKRRGLPIPVKHDLFVIGSGPMSQLRCRVEGVGEQHCALVTRPPKVFVLDLDSGRPTEVNGREIGPGREWPLHAGDCLTVGPFEFAVQFGEIVLKGHDLEEWALECLDKSQADTPADDGLGVRAAARPATPAEAAAAILGKMQAREGIVKGRLRVSEESRTTVIRFNDPLLVEEGDLALIRKELYENLSRPSQRVLLDFKSVRRMSTAFAELMQEIAHWLLPYGSTLALCRMEPELRQALEAVRFPNCIPQFAEKPVALASRW